MPNLILTNEQVIELVKQLPNEQQQEVFKFLILHQWEQWNSLSNYGVGKVRVVAKERGYNWDNMTEEEREVFIDEIIHEK